MQAEKSLRSVFVGNIPYDASEEKLRDIFSAVGPVLGFRILFDPETGKPKGYGFCEYKDQETATSAIRNLNGHDLGGRPLRVDSASKERARDVPDHQQQQQQQNQQQQQQQQSLLGDGSLQMQQPTQPEPLLDAQTVINNELCSMAPERLFEICKQLKSSLTINPNETKQLLVQNPQLSFAVLQTLVMIKAIDAQTAMNTLHKQLMQPAPMPTMMTMMQPSLLNPYGFMGAQPQQTGPLTQPMPAPMQTPMLPTHASIDPRVGVQTVPVSLPQTIQGPQMITNNPLDPRMNQATMDPRMNQAPIDPRMNQNQMDPRMNPNPMDPRMNPNPMDPRMNPNPMDPRLNANPMDPRVNSQALQATPSLLQPNPMDPRVSSQSHQPSQAPLPPNPIDPRQGQVSALDPRLNPADPRLQRMQ